LCSAFLWGRVFRRHAFLLRRRWGPVVRGWRWRRAILRRRRARRRTKIISIIARGPFDVLDHEDIDWPLLFLEFEAELFLHSHHQRGRVDLLSIRGEFSRPSCVPRTSHGRAD